MPWNGSGSFTRVHDWKTDRDGGVKIQASRFDAENDDFAAGIQAAVAKNGENAATANLPMGGFKHTAVANAAARNQYASAEDVQDGSLNYAVAGGTADVITFSLSPSITAYSEGVLYCFQPSANNATTTPTLNIDGVGAKTIVKFGSAALVAGDLVDDEPAGVFYNSTDDNFSLINPATLSSAITAGSTDTLTNKTIDGDDNTVQDLDFSAVIKTEAGNADKLAGYAATTGAPVEYTVAAALAKVSDTQGDILYRDGSGWVALGAGTSGDFLKTQGAGANPTWDTVDAGGPTLGTEQATTSGTTIDFTSIAAGTIRVTINLVSVSTNSSSSLLVQIGDSGGIETTGYSSGADNSGGSLASTAGFVMNRLHDASKTYSGTMTLTRVDSSGLKWVAAGSLVADDASNVFNFAGTKTLSAELDRVRLTTVSANTFDAGSVNITTE